MDASRHFVGELIGTFLLVFFGCGSVAVSVLFSAHVGLFQVAMVWGLGVAMAIYATRHLSCAHLNPAVSIAMVIGHRMSPSRLPAYLGGQFLGAFLAAAALYGLFSDSIAQYEALHQIMRGAANSVQTGMMFGEYYPNPGSGAAAVVTPLTAFLAEAIGTFVLVFLVFSLTEGCNVGRPDEATVPVFIGLTVTILISVIAPLTQAGLNPARDLAPRVFAMLAGWGSAALPDWGWGALTVYVIGPICGGALAAVAFIRVVEPLMADKKRGPGASSCLTSATHASPEKCGPSSV
ncbi:aquaporin family protein [Siculibacillus lacustris]|uniref:Aquaporin family protein n=1 Tax=Siculibacillus lacustris TaxID=1549641 RepID=A0A4Q9VCB8_9HYPH|nr:MIP/aquaporin family protein [Siculibacillus lacustris]TBW32127.1 aquaporin family protein [Siculibacillus lacustris]